MKVLRGGLLVLLSLVLHHRPTCHGQQPSVPGRLQPLNNEFAWTLFRYAKPTNPNAENFVMCPISVQLLLSVLQLAAEGATKDQIQLVVGNVAPAELFYILNPEGAQPEIKSANGIFIDSAEKLRDNIQLHVYLNMGIVYKVPLRTKPVLAKRAINAWAANATYGRIKDFLSADVDLSSVRAMLASAVYFRSTWKYQFTPSENRPFYTYPDQPQSTPFMEVEGYFKMKTIDLGRNVVGTMINLPYKDKLYSMALIVPGPGVSLARFIGSLDHIKFTNIIQDSEQILRSKVHLFMPKFKISTSTSLVSPLQKMGIVDLFSSSLSQLTNFIESSMPIRISEILQQSTLEVDEEGTVATSATAAFVVPLSAAEPEAQEVVIDKPFIAVIMETATQTPIFLAKLSKPKESGLGFT